MKATLNGKELVPVPLNKINTMINARIVSTTHGEEGSTTTLFLYNQDRTVEIKGTLPWPVGHLVTIFIEDDDPPEDDS